jgi:mono/diheme cytochrome c family protein
MSMKRSRKIPLALLLLGGLIVLLYGCAPAYRGAPILEPLVIDNPQIALGQQVFFSVCHQCHPGGATGLGLGITNKPLPDWAIRFQVRHGLGEMPAFSDEEISDEELHALVAYLNRLRERLLESTEVEASEVKR